MQKNLLKKYNCEIEELKKINLIDAIIIFGSYANNTNKPLSDLDLCIITNKKISKKTINQILSYSMPDFDICLFNKLDLSLQFKILTKGKIIYQKKDLTNLKIKTTNKWFDFRPILNRLYKKRGYPINIID